MENQLGTGYVLEVDMITDANTAARGTDANYRVLACLTTNTFDLTVAAQSTQNKCDGFYDSSIPGVLSWTFSAEGVATKLSTDEKLTRKNFQDLAMIGKSRKLHFYRWNNAEGDFIREGKCWMSAYNESAPNSEAYTFSTTLTGVGEPFLEEAV